MFPTLIRRSSITYHQLIIAFVGFYYRSGNTQAEPFASFRGLLAFRYLFIELWESILAEILFSAWI